MMPRPRISPARTTRLVVVIVSQATRASGSLDRKRSTIASEIWSATLSGWPSDTDSEVKRKSLMRAGLFEKAARIPNLPRVPTALLRCFGTLPLGLLQRLGRVLGWAMYGMSPTYRRHLRE